MDEILQKIKEAWKAPIVLRRDIAKFSFGLVTARSLQTLDSRGQGIVKSITINGKVAYTTDSVLKWLESRVKKQEEKKQKRPHKNGILLNA